MKDENMNLNQDKEFRRFCNIKNQQRSLLACRNRNKQTEIESINSMFKFKLMKRIMDNYDEEEKNEAVEKNEDANSKNSSNFNYQNEDDEFFVSQEYKLESMNNAFQQTLNETVLIHHIPQKPHVFIIKKFEEKSDLCHNIKKSQNTTENFIIINDLLVVNNTNNIVNNNNEYRGNQQKEFLSVKEMIREIKSSLKK